MEVKAWDGEETQKVNPVGLAVAAILGLTIGIVLSIITG